MDDGRWKLTAKLQHHTYIHIRHPNDPLKSDIHIHHPHKQQQTGYQHRGGNMDAGWWKI